MMIHSFQPERFITKHDSPELLMVSKLDTDEPSERSGGAGGLIRHPQQQHRAPGPLYRK
jgi:hypothetical protein